MDHLLTFGTYPIRHSSYCKIINIQVILGDPLHFYDFIKFRNILAMLAIQYGCVSLLEPKMRYDKPEYIFLS